MIKEINPQWVKVSGQIRRVSDFAHLAPPLRPKASCPLCFNPVIMKLGDIRVHHYAHQPDTVCAATQPETALHLNTKFYIYGQLLSGKQLYLKQQCSNGCGNSNNVSWVKDWDRVELESNIGPFRPDILIALGGKNKHAIEVKVTHPVETAKVDFYTQQNISWLEVEASEAIYEGEDAWRIAQPIPFAVCKPLLPKWTCSNCQIALKKEREEEIKEQRKEEYRKHNFKREISAKMVDFYYPSGRKFREIYYLKEVIRKDIPVRVIVETQKGEVVHQQYGEVTEAKRESAFKATKRKIDKACSDYRAIVDDREWSPWVPGKKFVARDIERYPFLYEWDGGVKKWIKQEQQKLQCRHNWIPKDGGGIVCTRCGTIVDSGKCLSGCTHYFINGICKWCGRQDELGFYDEEQ